MTEQKKTDWRKACKMIIKCSVILYFPALFFILFLFGRHYRYGADGDFWQFVRFNTNLVPFKTIGGYIADLARNKMNFDIPVKNLLGNLLLFLPAGVYLPLFFKRLGRLRVFAPVMIGILLCAEIFQLVTRTGSLDIDDIILNFLGAVIGFGLFKVIGKLLEKN